MKPPLAAARGLSLVELLIAMAIGMALALGLTVILANTSRSFRVQDDFSRLLDAGTSAVRYLADDIRMAGFYGTAGSIGSVDYASGGITAITNDCGAVIAGPPARPWALDMGMPIDVRGGLTQANVNATFPCIDGNNFQTDSPVIVLRGALGYRVPDANDDGDLAGDLLAEPNHVDTIYVQSLPNQDPNTVVFRGGDFADLKGGGLTRGFPNGDDASIFEYQARVYYIRPCSRPAPPATSCDAPGTDGGRPIPTLVRHELVGDEMRVVPLAEGIERISLRYGIDTDADGIPNSFVAAPHDWTQVVAVRVAVLARSIQPVAGHDDSGKEYDLGDPTLFTCTPGADCNFKRHVFTQTVGIRNCGVRRGATGAC